MGANGHQLAALALAAATGAACAVGSIEGPPGPPAGLRAAWTDRGVDLAWTDPEGETFASTAIVRWPAEAPPGGVDLEAPDFWHASIDADADCLVTPCPLCHLNLDLQQPGAAKVAGRELGMPVLHLPQLVGLALGLDAKELGLTKHVVKPTSVIDWSTSVVAGVGDGSGW